MTQESMKSNTNDKLLPVLMTASVDTRGMAGARYTAQEREKMYIEAIRYYLDTICRNPCQKIVFCDNSGWDLESLREKVGCPSDSVEWLSLSPDDFDISRGKGYNEMLLMAQAVARSCFIRDAGGFFKVTGRYPIYNLGFFVKRASKAIFADGKEWYCDIKDHPIYDWLHLGWNGHSLECRLFGVANGFFCEKLAPLTEQCNDATGDLLEDVLFRAVKGMSSDTIVMRFTREPHFGGVPGHFIQNLAFSQSHDCAKEKVKRFIGNFIRIFLPWLKF